MVPDAAGFRATAIMVPGIIVTGAVALVFDPVMHRLETGPVSKKGRM